MKKKKEGGGSERGEQENIAPLWMVPRQCPLVLLIIAADPQYIALARIAQKTPLQIVTLLFRVTHSRYLTMFLSLAPQFWLSADMPQYAWCGMLSNLSQKSSSTPPTVYRDLPCKDHLRVERPVVCLE
jgi:hypothetical protein